MADYRTTADIAELLGVTTDTIRVYRTHSRPGGRYEAHPFPAPDELVGRTPIWHKTRDDEIRAWASARPGRGTGGGRPAHKQATEERRAAIAAAQTGDPDVGELIRHARDNNRAALDRMD